MLDCGSYNLRAGFSGQEEPHTLDAHVRYCERPHEVDHAFNMGSVCSSSQVARLNAHLRQHVLGYLVPHAWEHSFQRYPDRRPQCTCVADRHAACNTPHPLRVSPVQQGRVSDWEATETLLTHALVNKLGLDPRNGLDSILMTESPQNPKALREKATMMMFEQLNVSKAYLGNTAVLSLYASGRTTGLVVDVGHDITTIAAAYEGYILPHMTVQSEFAGSGISARFADMLASANPSLEPYVHTSTNSRAFEWLKHQHCYVALDYANELAELGDSVKQIELPDGAIVTLGNEAIR